MKRKIFAVALTAAMLASLTACGGSKDSSTSASSGAASSAADEASDSAAGESSSASAESASSSKTASSSEDGSWVLNMDDMMAGTQFEGLEAEGDYSYQIIVKSFQNTYWQACIAGVNAAAEDLGVQVNSQGPNTESDIADQVNMLNSAINNTPDGIGISASDASAVTESLQNAMDKGVPVIAFDTPIGTAPEGSVAATIATDSIAAGGLAAQEAWDALESRVESTVAAGEIVRFGMVAQDATSTNHQQRGLGYVDKLIEIAKDAGYSVAVVGNEYFVGACSDAGDSSSAQIIIECAVPSQTTLDLCATEASAIMNESDTVCVYATGQTVAEGLVQANDNLQVLGTDPETDILGIGFDSGAILKEKVLDGTLYGGITQMPYAVGYYTVCALVALSNGDTVEDMNIPGYYYDADNMDSELIAPNLYD